MHPNLETSTEPTKYSSDAVCEHPDLKGSIPADLD